MTTKPKLAKLASVITLMLFSLTLSSNVFGQATLDGKVGVKPSEIIQNRILTAKVALVEAQGVQKDANSSFLTLQSQIAQLKEQYNKGVADESAAKIELEKAKAEAWEESKLDKTKYDLDDKKMEFVPKAEAIKVNPPTPASPTTPAPAPVVPAKAKGK